MIMFTVFPILISVTSRHIVVYILLVVEDSVSSVYVKNMLVIEKEYINIVFRIMYEKNYFLIAKEYAGYKCCI